MKNHFPIIILIILFVWLEPAVGQVKYWGLTSKGGDYNVGTIYFIERNSEEQHTVHSFNYGEGDSPIGSLTKGNDNMLYGTTPGGNLDYGTIFQYDHQSFIYQKMFEFNGGTGGFHPTGHLLNHPNGKIYGMTTLGGQDQVGIIFEYVPGESDFSVTKYFNGNDGARPEGGLTLANNGLLYGVTSYGGDFNSGVLFEFDPETIEYKKIYDFNPVNGMIPVCNLIQASNGRLYGVAPKGGTANSGVLFEYDIISKTYTKLIDFDGQNAGSEPAGSLIEASDGKLYGMTTKTQIVGNNSYGVIYSYDITNFQIHKLFEFDGLNGSSPTGSLLEIVNQKLIGVADQGGVNGFGVMFEFDITDGIFTKKNDFNGDNGELPIYSTLLKVYYVGVSENNLNEMVTLYPNPANDKIKVKLEGGYSQISYSLIDISGRIVRSNVLHNGQQIIIDVKSLTPGNYLLQLDVNKKTYSKKVTIN